MSGGSQTSHSRIAGPLRKPGRYALDEAQRLYDQQGPLPSTYVGISPERRGGLEDIYGMARGGTQVPSSSVDEYLRTIGGEYLRPNQYVDEVASRSANAAASPVISGFAQGGRFGSGAMANAASDVASGVASRIYNQNYQAERDRMTRALGMAPMMEGMQYADQLREMGVGQQYEQDERNQRLEEMRQYQYPYQRLGYLESSLAGSPFNRAGSITTGTEFDWLAAGLQGLGGILSPGGGMGGGGMGGGGGGGGLMGLFGGGG